MTPIRQVFVGRLSSLVVVTCSRFGIAAACLARAFLLLLDLEEFVATNFSNLLEASKELFVRVSNNIFLRSNYRILDAVSPDQLFGVR